MSSEQSTGQLAIGAVFQGRYQILRCIKAGGMGAVYEAMHLETRRRRALKVMLPSVAPNAELRARFKAEATVAAEVQSEHIVETFDAGVDADTGTPFLVMELLSGEELADTLQRRGPLPPNEVVALLTQCALALDKTHAAGIVHRDLKPENLFVTQRDDGTPRLKILDFGIAKVVAQGTTAAGAAAPTRSIGTPLYMAPEQIRGDLTLGPRTDLYALAHVAYTLLTAAPYWAEEQEQLNSIYPFLIKVAAGATEAPSSRAARRRVSLPTSFDAWFARAAAVDPAHRFARASEMIAALAPCFSPSNQAGARASVPTPIQVSSAPAATFYTPPAQVVLQAQAPPAAAPGPWRPPQDPNKPGVGMMLGVGGLLLLLVAWAVSRAGCIDSNKPPQFHFTSEPIHANKLPLHLETESNATVRVRGGQLRATDEVMASSVGVADVELPVAELPLGRVKLVAEIAWTNERGKQRTAEVPFEIDRPAVPARLGLAFPKGGDASAEAFTVQSEVFTGTAHATSDGHVRVQIDSDPGTQIEIDGQRVEVTANQQTDLLIDLNKQLKSASIPDVFQQGAATSFLKFPAHVRARDGGELSATISISAQALRVPVLASLKAKRGQPLRFEGDDETPVSKGLVHTDGERAIGVYGAPKRVADIGLVAFDEHGTRDAGTCGPYGKSAYDTFGGKYASHELIDTTVTIYERRTGKVLEKRTFMARPSACPSVLYGSEDLAVRDRANGDEIARWLTSKAR